MLVVRSHLICFWLHNVIISYQKIALTVAILNCVYFMVNSALRKLHITRNRKNRNTNEKLIFVLL